MCSTTTSSPILPAVRERCCGQATAASRPCTTVQALPWTKILKWGGGVLHISAMERGIVGADVSPNAAHLTASSLAAIGQGNAYGDTQIGWVEVGRDAGLTGTLEYLATAEVADLFGAWSGTSAGRDDNLLSLYVPDASVTWILMNPPYSRTRGGQSTFDIAGLGPKERKACQRRWKRLTRKEPVNNQAGMAASFLALARRKVRTGGRIGFVLPMTAAFADSWAVTREMVLQNFKEVTAIAVAGGKALGDTALSADTGMEEMLLVATRHDSEPSGPEPRVRCVTLHQAFTRVGEAGELARTVQQTVAGLTRSSRLAPIMAGEEEVGQALLYEPPTADGTWMPLGVTRMDLALAADALTRGQLAGLGSLAEPINLPVAMAQLDQVFTVGPTHHLIGHMAGHDNIGAFAFYSVTNQDDADGELRSLWAAQSREQRRLVVPPTHKAFGVIGDLTKPQIRMYASRGTLHYARNMRWTSQALLAATTDSNVMGGRAWTTLKHSDARVRAVCALWVNSIFGLVTHWTQGQRQQTGRATTQIGALRKIPCPRFDSLDDTALDAAAAAFGKLNRRTLLPACQAHADADRQVIDEAVVEVFDLPEAALQFAADLRLLWCREPSVHGRNRRAVALLDSKRGTVRD